MKRLILSSEGWVINILYNKQYIKITAIKSKHIYYTDVNHCLNNNILLIVHYLYNIYFFNSY